MSLQIVTPPTAEPVTVAAVKARLRLTTTADDANIALYISSAREFAERVTRRSLAAKSYALFMDRFPAPYEPIRLPAPPLTEVTAIKFYDDTLTQQTWDPTEYWVALNQSPALIVPTPGIVYPCAARVPGAVEIDFTTGPASISDDWQRVIENITIFIYEHPGEPVPEILVNIPKIYVF